MIIREHMYLSRNTRTLLAAWPTEFPLTVPVANHSSYQSVGSIRRLPNHGCKLWAHQIDSDTNTDTEITIRVMYFNHKRFAALDRAN